jgi:nickel-dependent lactate racemase
VDVSLPYGSKTLSIRIPGANLREVLSPHQVAVPADPVAAVKEALARPLNTDPLSDLAARAEGGRAAIVVDDNTRATPVAMLLDQLVPALEAGGIQRPGMTIIVALGSHRPMTAGELEEKLKIWCRRLRVVQHDHRNDLVDLGATESGIPVSINREVMEAGLVVGCGMVTPHNLVGYSGGAKLILPGVASEKTTGYLHTLYASDASTDLGQMENSLRIACEEVAGKVGLDFLVNVVLDAGDRLVGVFAGDFRAVHRAAARLSQGVYGIRASGRSDIVIGSCYPADLEFYQANKGLFIAQRLVRDHGTLILASPCPEGIASTHPDFGRFIGSDPDELMKKIESGEIDDRLSAPVAVRMGRVKSRIRIVLVTDGIGREDTERMGFGWSPSVQDAADQALRRYGPDASVTVLTHGGKSLPLLP